MQDVNFKKRFQTLVESEDLLFLGTVSLSAGEEYARYQTWLSESRHGEMGYLERNVECRKEPERLLPGAKCAVVVALPYFQGDSVAPQIAQYARFEDYHRLLKKKAERAVRKFQGFAFGTVWRVVVDSAPVLERALAAKTFSGFIGKNTCYIHPEHGSFLLLGEILTSYSFELDEKSPEKGCASCSLCQVECPTDALSKDYQIDASKCLAYWTIENRGTIPEEYWPHLKDFVFGCDICQSVCPYNEEARGNRLPKSIVPRKFPSLFETATMDQNRYEKYFGGTPLTRAKRNGLRRNALIAMTVTRDPQLAEALALAAGDCEEPIASTLEQIRVSNLSTVLGA